MIGGTVEACLQIKARQLSSLELWPEADNIFATHGYPRRLSLTQAKFKFAIVF